MNENDTHEFPAHILERARRKMSDSLDETRRIYRRVIIKDVVELLFDSFSRVGTDLRNERSRLVRDAEKRDTLKLAETRGKFVESFSTSEHPTKEYTDAVTELITGGFSLPEMTDEEKDIERRLDEMYGGYKDLPDEVKIRLYNDREYLGSEGYLALIPSRYHEMVREFVKEKCTQKY